MQRAKREILESREERDVLAKIKNNDFKHLFALIIQVLEKIRLAHPVYKIRLGLDPAIPDAGDIQIADVLVALDAELEGFLVSVACVRFSESLDRFRDIGGGGLRLNTIPELSGNVQVGLI